MAADGSSRTSDANTGVAIPAEYQSRDFRRWLKRRQRENLRRLERQVIREDGQLPR